jgi:hypothetical protein
MVRKWLRYAADREVGYWLRQRHRGLSVGAAWLVPEREELDSVTVTRGDTM